MTTKHTSNTLGNQTIYPNDDILQSNGVSIPLLTDFSAIDFEFFSDEEDNSCVVIDTKFQSNNNDYKFFGESTSMVKVSHPPRGHPNDDPLKQKKEEEYHTKNGSIDSILQQESVVSMIPTSESVNQSSSISSVLSPPPPLASSGSSSILKTTVESTNHATNNRILGSIDATTQTDLILPTEEQPVKSAPKVLSLYAPKQQYPGSPLKGSMEYKEDAEVLALSPLPASHQQQQQQHHPHHSPTSRSNSYQYLVDPATMKISFMEFTVGDIALFVPIDENKEHWMAFHSNRPHRYLAQESLEIFLQKDKQQRARAAASSSTTVVKERSRILGRIILIDPHVAEEEYNPHHLSIGTMFYQCFVEPLLVSKKRQAMNSIEK